MLPAGIEVGGRRAFAWAWDWPGWCRSGKAEAESLASLAEYLPRYRQTLAQAGVSLPGPTPPVFQVVERISGSVSTDFGTPGSIGDRDRLPLSLEEAQRQVGLLDAGWRRFEEVAAGASAELRKGPRGGGRDRDQVVAHVRGADFAYASRVGIRIREQTQDLAVVEQLRTAIHQLVLHPDSYQQAAKGWPLAYFLRRALWHVLDHLWEIEDKRSTTV